MSSALPFTPCLHQACLAQPGPMAPQNQHHPALREAWGHLAYVTMRTELATTPASLWDTVITAAYPNMVEAKRPKPRPPSLPRHTVRALPARGSCLVPRARLPGCSQHPRPPGHSPGRGPAARGGSAQDQRPPPRRGLAHALKGILEKGPQAFLRFRCPGFVFSVADSLAVAVLSLQRRLSTGSSTL